MTPANPRPPSPRRSAFAAATTRASFRLTNSPRKRCRAATDVAHWTLSTLKTRRLKRGRQNGRSKKSARNSDGEPRWRVYSDCVGCFFSCVLLPFLIGCFFSSRLFHFLERLYPAGGLAQALAGPHAFAGGLAQALVTN
jgi:hypothetical protein